MGRTYLALRETVLQIKRNDILIRRPSLSTKGPMHLIDLISVFFFSSENSDGEQWGHRRKAIPALGCRTLIPLLPILLCLSSLLHSGPVCCPDTAPASLRCSQL